MITSPFETRAVRFRLPQAVSAACVVGSTVLPSLAAAELVTVDLSTVERPVTHVASGSLYGLIENKPADLDRFLAPLKPKMFTNPAVKDQQQPWGDAFVVADRVDEMGATVTIRLADWFPQWPYAFTNIPDFVAKVEQSVARRKASGLDNFYGYEIWNEPDLTWDPVSSNPPFHDMWTAVHAKLRDIDPDQAIIGPSMTHYSEQLFRGFLTWARDNNVLPDIISWHQLEGQDMTTYIPNYRALEEELGIGPLPISINEYSDKAWIEDEGEPGASAPLIAKFERLGVDTACISYWDVPNAGRLGSLMANDNQTNGGWWLYKWYGDMSGDMVATHPPAPTNAVALDGFANLDTVERFASVVLGGHNNGTIEVVVEGFAESGIFGATAEVIVEHVAWKGRYSPIETTDTLQSEVLDIIDNRITVTIPNTNNKDGYHIILNPTADAPMGSGGADASGSGGGSNVGTGGSAAPGSGGNATTSTGGSTMAGTGGVPGSPETGGTTPSTGGDHEPTGSPDDDAGCSCGTHGSGGGSGWAAMLLLSLAFIAQRVRPRA